MFCKEEERNDATIDSTNATRDFFVLKIVWLTFVIILRKKKIYVAVKYCGVLNADMTENVFTNDYILL